VGWWNGHDLELVGGGEGGSGLDGWRAMPILWRRESVSCAGQVGGGGAVTTTGLGLIRRQ
jgi:hypothetical protein